MDEELVICIYWMKKQVASLRAKEGRVDQPSEKSEPLQL